MGQYGAFINLPLTFHTANEINLSPLESQKINPPSLLLSRYNRYSHLV